MFKKRGFFKCLLFLVIFFLKFSTIFHRSHMKTSSLKVTRENILCFSSTNTSGILYHYTSDSYATRQWQNIAEENWKLFLISLVVSLLLPKRMQDVFSVNKRYVLWSPSSGVVKTGWKRRRETLPRYSRKCSRNPANFLLNLSVTSLQTFPRNEGKKKKQISYSPRISIQWPGRGRIFIQKRNGEWVERGRKLTTEQGVQETRGRKEKRQSESIEEGSHPYDNSMMLLYRYQHRDSWSRAT